MASHRTFFITGASSGIGRATAQLVAERGGRVALFARREPVLRDVAAEVRERGGEALVVAGDVRNRERLAQAVAETVEAFGPIDAGVANAGLAAYGRATATDPEDFDTTVGVTLTGAVNTIQALLPELERRGEEAEPTLVVVGSAAGRVPLPLLSAYTAAKHGLRAYVDVLAAELERDGSPVRLSLVSPGPVNTPFWDHVLPQEGTLPGTLPGSYGPEDVAQAVLLAADTGGRGITVGGLTLLGQTLHSALTPMTSLGGRALAEISYLVQRNGEPANESQEPAESDTVRGRQPLTRPSALMAARRLLAAVGRSGR